MNRLWAMTSRLTSHQRGQVLSHLINDLALNEALALTEGRLPEPAACPQLHGTSMGRTGKPTVCSDSNAATATESSTRRPARRWPGLRYHRVKWLTQAEVLDEG